MTVSLRPYQQNAVNSCFSNWDAGHKNLLVIAAVGAGKTIIASTIMKLHTERMKTRILFLAHREELLEQTVDKLSFVDNSIVAGIEQGKNICPRNAQVMVASVATLRNISRLSRWCPLAKIGLIIIDECHHATADSYLDIIYEITKHNPERRLLGITATPIRLDGENLSLLFDHTAFRLDMPELIDNGYLCPVRGYSIQTRTSIRNVSVTQSGEFDSEELAAAIDTQYRNQVIVQSYMRHGENRPAIAFVANVAHAEHLAGEFRAKGITAQAVHGKMQKEERRQVIADYQDRKIQILTNVGVLTEGFDAPFTGCVIMGRPTKSPVTYPQCIGRGLRLHSSKKDCIVIDLIDLCSEVITLPKIFKLPGKLVLNGDNVRQIQRTAERAKDYQIDVSWETEREYTTADIRKLLQPPDFFHLAETITPNTETTITWMPVEKHFVCVVDLRAGRVARLNRDDLGDWHFNFCSTHLRLGGKKQEALFSATAALTPLLTPEELARVASEPAPAERASPAQLEELQGFQIQSSQLEKISGPEATKLLQKLNLVRYVFRTRGQLQQGRYVGQYHELVWFWDPEYMEAVARVNAGVAARIQPLHTLHWLRKHRPDLFEHHGLPSFDELVELCRTQPNRYHSVIRNALEASPEFLQMKAQHRKHRSQWTPKQQETSQTK